VATAADTYLTGSSLAISGHLKIGTILRWRMQASKTAAGTGVPTYNLRVGTGATVTDTARCTVTGVAQTAATDSARFDVIGVVRATGATTVICFGIAMVHRNGTAGFRNDETAEVREVTSTGFTSTPAGTVIGLSVVPNTSGVWTFGCIAAVAENIV